MIHFRLITDPTYPSTATLAAEDRADAVLAQQRAAERRWTEFWRAVGDEAAEIIAEMPLGLGVHGYDAPGILSLVRRDFVNLVETTMEDACDAVRD
jgi:hypothetical protein